MRAIVRNIKLNAMPTGGIPMMHGGHTESKNRNCGSDEMKRVAFRRWVLQGMIILIAVMCAVPAFAKGGDTLWVKGDLLPHLQKAVVSAVDGNGNIIVAGYQNLTSSTDDDFWTVKFTADGTMVWREDYNRLGGSDRITALAVDSANNVIVTGYAWNGINNDIHTIKYSADGTVLWQHTYNGAALGNDIGNSVVVDTANNLVYVGGYTQNSNGGEDYLLLKYANTGAAASNPPLQTLIHPGPDGGDNYINSVALCAGGVAVTGSSWNGTDFDFLTIKYGSDGTELWDKRHTSSGSYPDNGRYVKCDQAGNVIVTGFSSNALDRDIHTAKYRAVDGVPLWQMTYNGAFDDEPAGLSLDSAGNVYITGYTWTLSGYNDFYTVKYNGATGAALWEQLFDSGKGAADLATATGIVVDEAAEGDVFVTGYTITSGNYDFQTLKYKKETGHLLWQRSYNGVAGKDEMTVGIGLTADGNVYISGWSDKSAQQDGGIFTATGGSKSTIINSAKSWVVDQWKNYYVYLTSGNKSGQYKKILGNTSDTLTVSVDFGDAVTAGTGYYIYDKEDYDLYVMKYDKGSLNPPTSLTAKTISKAADGKYTIQLAWEDNSANENGFRVERKLGDQSNWSSATILPVGADITSLEDTGLLANNYYYYRIKAYNVSEETYPSNEAHALTFLVAYQDPVWSNITDGGYNLEDVPTAISVGPDNNPVVTGYSDSGDLVGTFDYYTIKYSSANGAPLWSSRYNSMQDEIDQAKCLSIDNNNDVVVSGQSSLFSSAAAANINSVFTIKYSSSGDSVLWEKQYNGPGAIDDRSTAIASVTDGSITVITGYGKNSNQDEDIYLVKYLSDGALAWAATPYNGGRNDFPVAVVIDKDGNIVLTGYTQNLSGLPGDMNNYDFFTAKYNGLTGDMIWHDHYNVTGSGDNKANGIADDINGDIYITGYATNASGDEDIYTIKYNGSNGNRIWERPYDGPVSGNDRAVAIKVDPVIGSNSLDGNIVVLGTQVTAAGDEDIKVIRYSSAGEVKWERTLQRPDINDTAVAMDMDKAGYIYIAGNTGSDIDTDILSIIYDYEGTLLGGTIFRGGSGYDEASAITANHLGEAFIAGSTPNISGNLDYVVYKQKNNYILAPSPFAATSQTLYSQLQLTWSNNTANTNVVIERTPGPVTDNSVWGNLTTLAYPATSYMDTGLSAGTQYCYRIEALSGTLPSRKVFTCGTTTLPMPVVTASAVATTQLTLNWDTITGNTGYKVERKIGAGGWGVHLNGILPANTTSFTDTLLTAGSQYTYRVSTRNSAGYSLPSTEKMVWTLPLSPSSLSYNNAWANRVDLSWGNVVGETGFRVLRKTTGAWETLATLPPDVLTYSDTTAVANTQYYYSVASFNSSGENLCAQVPVLTKALPVLQYAATKPAAESITLSWQDIEEETAYIVQESTCSSANSNPAYCNNNFYGTDYWTGWTEVLPRPVANTTSFSRTGLTSGNEYRYRVIAVLPNNLSEPSSIKGAWAGLSTPITLTTEPASVTSLTLNWNDILGESAYEIYRDGVKIATTVFNIKTYTDSGLATQTAYCYYVKAINSLVNADSLPPTPISSGVSCLPTPLPAPVLSTPPTVQSTTQITVNWATVAGSNRYELERCQYTSLNDPLSAQGNINNPASWSSCVTIPVESPVTTSYVDTLLAAGYTYRYRIKDYYGTSPEYSSVWSSPIIGGTLLAGPPTITTITSPGGTQMTTNWADITGETEYRLWWKPRIGTDCTTGTWNGPITLGPNVISYLQSGLSSGTYYCYKINAKNSSGETLDSSSSSQTTALSPPVLATPTNITTSCVTLTWANLNGNAGYKVWKKIGSGGTYAELSTLAPDVTTYPDCTLSAGTYYGYQLEAVNAGGISARSNEQAFTSTAAKTALNATAKSTSSIAITWSVRLGATNYKLERKPGASGDWAEITSVAAAYTEDYCGAPAPTIGCLTRSPSSKTYQDQSLQANTTYCYRVRPWNSAGGNGEYSDPDCVTTSSLPSASLTAAHVNSFSVRLDWIPETCSGGTCEIPDGYEVEKGYGKNLFSRIATVPAPDNTFTQRIAINPGTRNTYRVRSYNGVIDSFDAGIKSASWGQQGVVYSVLGNIVSNVSVPPINISGSNGIARITATNGGVQLHTSSPNAGHPDYALNKYNYTRMNMLDVTKIHDNFDVQVDFTLPDTPVTATSYHVYGRLHVSFPAGTGPNYAYVERSTNSYGANIIINNVSYAASFATKDTIGKLRLSRMGDVISAYAWTGGTWVLIKEMAGFSTGVATDANLTQYVHRIEPITLKIIFDNYEATTQRPAYSNEATATTPAYVTGDNTCQ